MESLLLGVMTLMALVGVYSFISILLPLRPFRTRVQAIKAFAASIVVLCGSAVALGGLVDPERAARDVLVESEGGSDATGSDVALTTATVSAEKIPAACGDGGLAMMDEVSVTGTHVLHASVGGEEILNERATAALGEPHFQNVDNTQSLLRTCWQNEWTEIEVLTPEWLKGIRGWVSSEAIRVVERGGDGKRILVEADVYWDDNSSKFKPQIVSILNRIIRENSRCEQLDTGSVVLSSLESKPGSPVFSVNCNSGSSLFNVTFSPGDAEGEVSFAAVQPIGRSAAAGVSESLCI